MSTRHTKPVASESASSTSTTERRRKRDTPPEPSAEAPSSAHEPTGAEADERNQQWLSALEHTPTGKQLLDYLAHVEGVCNSPESGVECPVDQATTFRRVLVSALDKHTTPFGLPRTLPKFMAVCSLAGRRMLLTTELPVLFQLLAHSPNGARCAQSCMAAMKTILEYQCAHPGVSLLMTYSLPFQMDMPNIYWDVRTLRRMENGRIKDGELGYVLGEPKPVRLACTSGPPGASDEGALMAMIDAFGRNMRAIDLDITVDSDAQSIEGIVSERVDRLEQMVTMLKTDRRRLQTAHREELIELKDTHSKTVAFHASSLSEAYEQERFDEVKLREQIDKLEAEGAANRKTLETRDRDIAKLKADRIGDRQIWDEERKGLMSRLSLQEASTNQGAKQLTRANDAREKVVKKMETEHARTLDQMERKLGKATMAERAAKAEGEELLARMQSLSKAMEGTDAQQEALNAELTWQKRTNKILTACVHLGGHRYTQLAGRHTVSAFAVGQANIERESLLKMSETAASERDALGDANSRLQKEVEELQAALSAAPPKPPMADASSMTVPVTSKAELELGELQTQHAKLRDELDTKNKEFVDLKAELQRTKERAKRRPPPTSLSDDAPIAGPPPAASPATHGQKHAVVGTPTTAQQNGPPFILNQVHIGNGQSGTDLGHDPNMDPSVEAIIQQAAHSLRTLADIARESTRHKGAAHEAWAHVRALQNYTGYQVPQYPMQMHGGFVGSGP